MNDANSDSSCLLGIVRGGQRIKEQQLVVGTVRDTECQCCLYSQLPL